MEEQFNSTNEVSKIGRVSYRITMKLGKSYKVNGISTKHHEEAI